MKLSPQDKFEVYLAALLLAFESGRADLLPVLKIEAQRAARQMNGKPTLSEQRRAAKLRGVIRRVSYRDGYR
jgi:hypothetical protein